VKTSRRKIILYSFYPLISENFTIRVTEASFTGMGNDNILVRMLWTSIFVITQFLRVTAREHLQAALDELNDLILKLESKRKNSE